MPRSGRIRYLRAPAFFAVRRAVVVPRFAVEAARFAVLRADDAVRVPARFAEEVAVRALLLDPFARWRDPLAAPLALRAPSMTASVASAVRSRT